jgi:hypothetical protein
MEDAAVEQRTERNTKQARQTTRYNAPGAEAMPNEEVAQFYDPQDSQALYDKGHIGFDRFIHRFTPWMRRIFIMGYILCTVGAAQRKGQNGWHLQEDGVSLAKSRQNAYAPAVLRRRWPAASNQHREL